MIIDCHGHFTTAPDEVVEWRKRQLAHDGGTYGAPLNVTDDELAAAVDNGQIRMYRERGHDKAIFSPFAGRMGHHEGGPEKSIEWSRLCNDLIHRVCTLRPDYFVGVCQLPQSPNTDLTASVAELERCVTELGFIGCNLNPDPSGGYWNGGPPITDRLYYPLYEKMCELDVPAMIHVSASPNPVFHYTGSHYLNGDTAVFMQLLHYPTLFRDFPDLRLIIPHGGGAVPYHWGRYRGLAQDMGLPPLEELVLGNVYFDTCVYHQAGIDLLTRVIPHQNILFGSELLGAVNGVDPETGHQYDDTKRYVDATPNLTDAQRADVYSANHLKVYPRLKDKAGA